MGHFVDLTDCSYKRDTPCRASHCHTVANTFRHLIHSNDKLTHNKNNFLKFNYYLNSTVTLLVRITTLFIRILVFKRRSYDIYSIYTYSI